MVEMEIELLRNCYSAKASTPLQPLGTAHPHRIHPRSESGGHPSNELLPIPVDEDPDFDLHNQCYGGSLEARSRNPLLASMFLTIMPRLIMSLYLGTI